MPTKLTGTDNKAISYIYDANVQKLAKTAEGKTMYYAGNMIYEEASLQYILNSEGKYDVSNGTGQYQFDIKDHLGNVRMVVDINGTELEQSAYYPFGMAFQKGGNDNKYLHNGKELQDDKIGEGNLDWYDYGARFYDAALGRWHVIDNKAEKYYSTSPYTYALNNPIVFVDPDGNDIRIFYDGGHFDFNGSNYNSVPKNSFVTNVLTAYAYNVSNGGGQNMMDAALSDKIVSVRNGSEDLLHGNSTLPGTNAIKWNAEQGMLQIAEDGDGNKRWVVTSPASSLEHEFAHKSEDRIDGDRNKEEERVITGPQTDTAKANGEIKSDEKLQGTYDYRTKMAVAVSGGPTSTKVDKEKTKAKVQKMDDQGYEVDQYDILGL